ncbi:MAG: phenylalanine--tRNA ligase subunit beta [Actinomycetes bacterium]
MRVPMSWLRALLPDLTADADEVAAALVRAGLEVEQVHRVGHDVRGVVVAEVLDVEDLTGFKKPIRYCHVGTGSGTREVVCGATNFAPGDRVPFALPGAELPGGFQIATRQTYGRTSDGMICSEAELGLAAESPGIMVLPRDTPVGADVVELLELRDEALDIAVTPDRGYTLSIRGVAREVATAFGLVLDDPADVDVPAPGGGHPVRLDDPAGCDRYVARVVEDLDPAATSPPWLQRRLVLAGMRPVSLAVDVTNAVMLELGQPLHAFDLASLSGEIVVRRARAGERLTTLDGQDRQLDPDDLLITDDSGPIALAGVMGGQSTEVGPTTTSVLLESAHFAPVTVARTARRHRLPSEASRRFERGVDPALPDAAAEVAVRLLQALGGARPGPVTDADARPAPTTLRFPVDAPARTAGRDYPREVVLGRLADVGCEVSGDGDVVDVVPPSWRPDLTGTAELVEEVVRLEGYDTIPVELPVAPAGRGLTAEQRLRRTASRALAAAGLVEVVLPPFVGEPQLAALGGDLDAPALVNPLSEEERLLRPSLLPGLLSAAGRNVSRGLADVGLFETGSVFLGSTAPEAPVPGVESRPDDAALAALDATLPQQPRHLGVVLTGRRTDGLTGRPAEWSDAVEAVVAVGRALGLDLTVRAAAHGPFHPGRCAELLLDDRRVGLAGELHPRTVAALGLPARTCAAEANLDVLVEAAAARGPVPAPVVSHFPHAAVDVALVVGDATPAADVEAALRSGAGPLLEDLRLFDVYTGPQLGEGQRSLAYALRFRAPDRTLTDDEVLAARDAAVAEAGRRTGAVLRGA